jgi:hypothetical protein
LEFADWEKAVQHLSLGDSPVKCRPREHAFSGKHKVGGDRLLQNEHTYFHERSEFVLQPFCARAIFDSWRLSHPAGNQNVLISEQWFQGNAKLHQPSEAAVLKVLHYRKTLRANGNWKELARSSCCLFTWPKMVAIVSEMERVNKKIHKKAEVLTMKRNLYRIKKEADVAVAGTVEPFGVVELVD